MTLYCYPKCTTCKKAVAFLEENNIEFTYINIKEEPPNAKALAEYYAKSGLALKKFFNTSGMSYRNQNIKEKFDTESDDQLIDRLSKDGMLIKRPLLVKDDVILTGFKEQTWRDALCL